MHRLSLLLLGVGIAVALGQGSGMQVGPAGSGNDGSDGFESNSNGGGFEGGSGGFGGGSGVNPSAGPGMGSGYPTVVPTATGSPGGPGGPGGDDDSDSSSSGAPEPECWTTVIIKGESNERLGWALKAMDAAPVDMGEQFLGHLRRSACLDEHDPTPFDVIDDREDPVDGEAVWKMGSVPVEGHHLPEGNCAKKGRTVTIGLPECMLPHEEPKDKWDDMDDHARAGAQGLAMLIFRSVSETHAVTMGFDDCHYAPDYCAEGEPWVAPEGNGSGPSGGNGGSGIVGGGSGGNGGNGGSGIIGGGSGGNGGNGGSGIVGGGSGGGSGITSGSGNGGMNGGSGGGGSGNGGMNGGSGGFEGGSGGGGGGSYMGGGSNVIPN